MDFCWEDEPEPKEEEEEEEEEAKDRSSKDRSSKDRSNKRRRKPKTQKALKAALYEALRDIPDIIPECRAHNLNEFRRISYVHVYIY